MQDQGLNENYNLPFTAEGCKDCGRTARNEGRCRICDAVYQARCILREPLVVLDTETTGLGPEAEIISLCLLNGDGEVLLNTYVKPSVPIDESGEAFHINGITNAMVADAPTILDMYKNLVALTHDKNIACYNAEFDQRLMEQTLRKVATIPIIEQWNCIMKILAQLRGIPGKREGEWQYCSLAKACELFQIDAGEAHNALNDARASLAVLKAIAAYEVKRVR